MQTYARKGASNMNYTMEQYRESAEAIASRLDGFVPEIAMILGSGLGYMGDEMENAITINYSEIPHFKHSTAPGHRGRLVFGYLEGKAVAGMQGRMHHYEGYSYEEVSYAVRVLRLLGCKTLIVTNAAGCVRTDWKAGELMLITDHIKMFSESPLRGENLPEFGVRFPDASNLYTPALRQMARETAAELGISRSGLFSKIKALTDVTPNEMIQVIRLKHAASLLLSESYRVNEVCYMVGFSSPSYFAKCFQKQYGCTPAKYKG